MVLAWMRGTRRTWGHAGREGTRLAGTPRGQHWARPVVGGGLWVVGGGVAHSALRTSAPPGGALRGGGAAGPSRPYQPRTGSGLPFPQERSHGECAASPLPSAIRRHPPPSAAPCGPTPLPPRRRARGNSPRGCGRGGSPGVAGEPAMGAAGLAAAPHPNASRPRRPAARRST